MKLDELKQMLEASKEMLEKLEQMDKDKPSCDKDELADIANQTIKDCVKVLHASAKKVEDKKSEMNRSNFLLSMLAHLNASVILTVADHEDDCPEHIYKLVMKNTSRVINRGDIVRTKIED